MTVTNTSMIAGPDVWMLSEVLTMPCSLCTDWHRLSVKQWGTGLSHGSKMSNLCKSNRRQYSWEKYSENILWRQYLCQFKEGNCSCKSIKRKYWSNLTLLKTFLQGSACYSEEIFHFPGILKSTQNKGIYVNFQFGEKSNYILCALWPNYCSHSCPNIGIMNYFDL